MPELETMKWTTAGKIARVIFNRPHVLNAMDNQTTMDLNTIADAVAKEKDVRVVILSGAGRAFSTGIDLKQLSANQIDMTYHYRFERAKRYVLSGENIKAREALTIGLVDYVVPLAQFDRRVEKIAHEYAKVCAVGTIQSKHLTNESFDLEYEPFLKKYFERQEIAQTSDDHMEARRAYREKRDPAFE